MSENQDHVQLNYDAFLKQLPELLDEQEGKYALIRDQEIVEFFDTASDAYLAGENLYPDGRFSIQEVTSSTLDLGFYSHALH